MSCSVEECSLITHRWRGRNRGSQKENDGEEMRERERFIESSGMSEKLSGGLVDNVLSLLLSLFLIVSLFLNFLKLVTRSEKNIPSLYQWIKLNVMNNNSWRNCNVPNIQCKHPQAVFLGYSHMQFCWRDGMLFHLICFQQIIMKRRTDVLRNHSQYT